TCPAGPGWHSGPRRARKYRSGLSFGTSRQANRLQQGLEIEQVRHEGMEIAFYAHAPRLRQCHYIVVARRRQGLPELLPALLICAQGELPGRHDEGSAPDRCHASLLYVQKEVGCSNLQEYDCREVAAAPDERFVAVHLFGQQRQETVMIHHLLSRFG